MPAICLPLRNVSGQVQGRFMALEAVLAKRCEEKGAFGRCRGERYCRRILRLSVTGGDELQTGADNTLSGCVTS